MKHLYFLLLQIACCCLLAQTQSWTPIQYGVVYNYQFSDSQTISHTVWIDSIVMENGSYASYLNKAVSSPCTQSNFCHTYYQTPQFLQHKFVRVSDSLFIFKTPQTYYLRPLADIGETWVFDSISQITATVYAIDTQTVFNMLDTLKTIHLSNGELIKLSQKWGIFSFPQLGTGKSFQLVGIESQGLGKLMPTYKEMYDWEVGDVFCYEEEYFESNGLISSSTYYIYTKKKIIEKQIFPNAIQYKIELQKMKKVNNPYTITNYPIQTDTITYNSYQQDPFLANYRPNTFYLSNTFIPNAIAGIKAISKRNGKTSMFSVAESNGDMPYPPYLNIDTIDVPTAGEFGHIEVYDYTTGLGLTYQKTEDFGLNMWGDPVSNRQIVRLTSYIHGQDTLDEICPDWLFTALNIPFSTTFQIYPNPASDRLFLYYNNPQLQNCVFAVRDIAGRQLVPPTPLENSTTYEMRIGDWAKGLYFVEVRDEKGNVFTEKFVKE